MSLYEYLVAHQKKAWWEYVFQLPQVIKGMFSKEDVELDSVWNPFYLTGTQGEFVDKLKERIVFAGGAWSWSGFAPCNGFSVAASRAAVSACEKNGVQDIFFTVWKDDGSESSLFSILPSLFCAAEYCAGNMRERSPPTTESISGEACPARRAVNWPTVFGTLNSMSDGNKANRRHSPPVTPRLV